jgi:uncharacterized protein with HEPN domain
MSTKRTVKDWVDDIHSAMQNIRSDIGDMTKTEFMYDGKTVRAVTKSITDIGEAAHQMMDDFPGIEEKYPEIWSHLAKVYAMRIKLTHGYFGIDAGIVWDTTQTSLPLFESVIAPLAENDGGDGAGGGASGGPRIRL